MDKLINLEDLGAFRTNLVNDSATSELATWSSSKINTQLGAKQGTLTAGANISISGDTIAAEGYVFDGTKGSFAEKYFDDDHNVIAANTATGIGAHAEGYATTASGDYGSHAEGYDTKATYTAEGGYNHGVGAHAEGWGTEAKHDGAHAEGTLTKALGQGSHAEGAGSATLGHNQALGQGAHAEGCITVARNLGEHAEGYRNVSHSTGNPNPFLAPADNTTHSVGVGTNSAAKNAQEIMYNGDMYVFGVGNYDGVHIKNEQGAPANTQTLQEVIAGKQAVLTAGSNISISGNTISAEYVIATTAEIEALFVPAPNYPARNQIWYETVNGQISNDFGLYVMLSGGVPATSSNIVSHTYSNGKGVITYDSDIYSLAYFPMEDSGQEDFVNNIKKFWLPYFTEAEEQQGDADIDMLNCLLTGQSNLTDVYYPGTVEELNYFVFPEEGSSEWECLRGAGTNSIHCSDGDRRVYWG